MKLIVLALCLVLSAVAASALPKAQVKSHFTDAALTSWVASLRGELDGGRARLVRAIRRLDPAFSLPSCAACPSAEFSSESALRMVQLDGDIDGDGKDERVIHVRITQPESAERYELHWIGVFKRTPQGWRLSGRLADRVLACSPGKRDLSGLAVRLVKGKLLLTRQRVRACGSQVDYDYVTATVGRSGSAL